MLASYGLNDTHAQQNNTLFFMHSIPEANFVNPAVQIECGTFIGLPLISSFHMNIANSGFTAGKFLTLYTDNTISRNFDMETDGMPNRNYFLTEFHAVLLAVGIKRKDYYYTFTVTEKNNAMIMYTPDLAAFSLRGEGEFEGQLLSLKGTNVVFNHLREYAVGISKEYSDAFTFGIKLKLLFGKLNYTTGKSSFGLFVEDGTRDLIFDFDAGYNSSMPWALSPEGPNTYRYQEVYDASFLRLMMNGRNPGLALDVGFIYKYNADWTFSGSLLDLGTIWYRSNLSNYSLEGVYTHTGTFGDGRIDNTQLWPVFDELNANMNESLTADPYFFMLDPRLYLGASYKMNKRYNLNVLLYNRFMPGKIQTGTTLSITTNADKAFRPSVSWSYMNNSPLNLGLGLAYGRKPIQLYFVSDNILGFVLPFATKNVNLRMGLNLRFGCNQHFDADMEGCSWMQKEAERRQRKDKLRR
jgi:hypothetical protein